MRLGQWRQIESSPPDVFASHAALTFRIGRRTSETLVCRRMPLTTRHSARKLWCTDIMYGVHRLLPVEGRLGHDVPGREWLCGGSAPGAAVARAGPTTLPVKARPARSSRALRPELPWDARAWVARAVLGLASRRGRARVMSFWTTTRGETECPGHPAAYGGA